jgi:hypothetical protein
MSPVLRGVDLCQSVAGRDLVKRLTRALVVLHSLVSVGDLDRGRVSEITRAPDISIDGLLDWYPTLRALDRSHSPETVVARAQGKVMFKPPMCPRGIPIRL